MRFLGYEAGAIAALLSAGSCVSQVIGSHGEVYSTDSPFVDSVERDALLGSAANDLACPAIRNRLLNAPTVGGAGEGPFIIDGCGMRATYTISYQDSELRCILIAKVALPGTGVPVPPASPATSSASGSPQ